MVQNRKLVSEHQHDLHGKDVPPFGPRMTDSDISDVFAVNIFGRPPGDLAHSPGLLALGHHEQCRKRCEAFALLAALPDGTSGGILRDGLQPRCG